MNFLPRFTHRPMMPQVEATLRATRELALTQLIRGVIWVALFALAAFTYTATQDGTWGAVIQYSVLFLVLIGLNAARRIAYSWRAGIFVSLLYVVAAISLVNFGIGSAGRIFLLGFAVLVTGLFGARAGLWASLLALATWAVVGLLFGALHWQVPAPTESSAIADWVSGFFSLLLLLVALNLPQRQFLEMQATAVVTAFEKSALEEVRAALQEKTDALAAASHETATANEKLQAQSQTLERRAAQLALSAEVARVAASLHDLPELLTTVVRLIGERFEFYHAGLFLTDEAGEWAVLQAANSPGGQRMLARRHRLRIGRQGLVGHVIASGQPRIAQDVGGDTVHFANPDLPETRSEMALPLTVRAVIIGALDVQSTAVNAFDEEDVRTLQTLANQIAVAIENARLFEATQRNLEELRALQREARQRTTYFTETAAPLAYRYDGVTVQPAPDAASVTLTDVAPRFTEDTLHLPLNLGQETLGTLDLRRQGEAWSADDVELTEAIANRLALALENARLFEQAQGRAEQMATLSEVALEFTGPQFSLPHLLDLIARRARHLLRADGVGIWLPAGADEVELRVWHDIHNTPLAGQRLPRTAGLAGAVLKTAQVVRVDDYAAWSGQVDLFRQQLSVQAALGVPMTWQHDVLGVLTFSHFQAGMRFAAEDERVATLFATQAAAALENARLLQETQQRLGELAMLNSIGQVAASQVALSALLDTVGDQIFAAFRVTTGYIALYNPDTKLIEFPYTLEGGRRVLDEPPMLLGEGLSSRVLQTRQPLLINRDTARRMAELGAQQTGAEALSYLAVPLIAGEQAIGLISLQDLREEGRFDEGDVRLLSTIAANIGAAIQNARLFDETRRRVAELATINTISEALSSQLELGALLDLVGDKILQAFPAADGGYIALYDHRTNLISLPFFSDAGQRVTVPSLPLGRGLSSLIVQTRRPLFVNRDTERRLAELGAVLTGQPARSYIGVPMIVGDEVVGVLSVQSLAQEGLFTDSDLRLLTTIAANVGVALQNARLFTQTQAALAENRTLFQISRALAQVSSVPQILRTVVQHALPAGADHAFIIIFHHGASGEVIELEVTGFADTRGEYEHVGQRLPAVAAPLLARISTDPLLISDVAGAANVDTLTRYTLNQYRIQAAHFLPLRASGQLLGVLAVSAEQPFTFPAEALPLLQTTADQVAVTMEKLRLLSETERRAQQLSTLNELGRAVSGQLNSEMVLASLFHTLQNALPLDTFFVALHQPGPQTFTFPLYYEAGATRRMEAQSVDRSPFSAAVLRDQQPRLLLRTAGEVEDVRLHREQTEDPSVPSGSLMFAPLVVGAQTIGVISAQTYALNAYTPDHLRLLVGAAGQAAIALENARLFTETQRRADQLATAAEVGRASISVLDPDALIIQTVELIRARFALYYTALFLVDEAGQWARLRYATGEAGRTLMERGHQLEVGGNSMVGQAVARRESRIALDVGQERMRFANPLLPDTRSELALPLAVGDTVLGALSVQSTQANAFSPTDLTILQTMADQIAVALQNARLFAAAQKELAERKRAEEELRKFRLGIERAEEAVFITDTNGTILYANPAFEKVYGFTLEETLGQNPRLIKSGKYPKETYTQLWNMLLSKQVIHQSALINKTKDGRLIPVEATANPILDEAGNLLGFLAIQRDITERQHAEAALNYERDLLRTLLDNVPDKIYFKDRESHFIRASQAVARQFGLTPEQLVGKSDFDFFTPEHAQHALADEQEMLRSGQSVIGQLERETWPDRPDTWVLSSKLVMRDAEGQVIGSFGISRDVTELKQAQDAAQRRAQLLATAAEVGRAATSTLDLDTLLRTSVNLIRDRFGFYHASVFLVDARTEMAVIRESTGEAGRVLKARQHALAVGSRSLVGTATATRQTMVAQDVTSDPTHLKNPLLPDTRAEAVLPLVSGDRVIGALDVQSVTPNAFTPEDLSILATIADQLAVAVQNANLFERTARQARREKLVVDITSKIRAAASMDAMLQTAVSELKQALGVSHGAVRLGPPEEKKDNDGQGRNGGNGAA